MKKEFYEAPEVELLELALEAGFAESAGGRDSMEMEEGFGS